jgi:hypothetical protein
MFCDSLLHIRLPTAWADARRNALHDQPQFTAFKGNNRKSINGFRLPANQTEHDDKTNLTRRGTKGLVFPLFTSLAPPAGVTG